MGIFGHVKRRRDARARGRSRARPLAAAALALSLALATVANAQIADLGATVGEQNVAGLGNVDTDLTPVAKPSALWDQVGGAPFGGTSPVRDSPTTYDEDFFTASFKEIQDPGEEPPELRVQEEGFVAGTRCRRQDPDQEVPPADVEECERLPVIYHYPTEPGLDVWEESYVAPESDPGGYVGATAWVDGESAIAVGGDGAYPRSEHPRQPVEPYEDWVARDPAGMARAWLYESGSWRELRNLPDGSEGDELPDAMRGLTAVDCSQRGEGFCVAGGLGQLWYFRDGGFQPEPVTDEDLQRDLVRDTLMLPRVRAPFVFRVRDVEFRPANTPVSSSTEAVAVTSGCCGERPSDDLAAELRYANGQWSSSFRDIRPDRPESIASVTYGIKFDVVHNGYEGWSNLLSSFTQESPAGTSGPGSWLLAGESYGEGSGGRGDYSPREVPARLLSADGDYLGYCGAGDSCESWRLTNGDDVADWAVGARKSGQAVAYTTAIGEDRRTPNTSAIGERLGLFPDPSLLQDPEEFKRRTGNQKLVKLPSYSLNAADLVAEQRGWAAGDHGAIMRLGSSTAVGAEPEPPKLGSRAPGRLSDRSAYTTMDPPVHGGSAVPVPPLAGRPRELLSEPRLIPWGAPTGDQHPISDDVASIVMSRDGSEGWAIGARAGGPFLYRYDGATWRRCDVEGVLGEPDPACAGLAGVGGLGAAARVPYEYDSDPTNDERFEVVAMGNNPVVARYSNRRWQLDEAAQAELGSNLQDIAFTGPEDGWIVGGTFGRGIYHFDDQGWTACSTSNRELCDDSQGRLPFNDVEGPNFKGRGLHLTVAGERVYMYGARRIAADSSANTLDYEPYPMVIYRDPGGEWTAEDGGYDPGLDDPTPEKRGRVWSVSVVRRASGDFEGWATGSFGPATVEEGAGTEGGIPPGTRARLEGLQGSAKTMALRLDPNGAGWQAWRVDDALADYRRDRTESDDVVSPDEVLVYPGSNGVVEAALGGPPRDAGGQRAFPVLRFDPDEGRWGAIPTPFFSSKNNTLRNFSVPMSRGYIRAMSPDGAGGLWLAVKGTSGCGPCLLDHDEIRFYRYTDRIPTPVFEDAPHPIRERVTAAEGGSDGSFWVGTDSEWLYRYDRIGSWERVSVPGWQAGRVQTDSRAALGLAIGPDGEGLAVGEQGRIVDLAPDSVSLDEAAGTSCSRDPTPPCGTSRDLSAAAVAPDGSALVGGAGRALLYRPAGGGFRVAEPPPAGRAETIASITIPTPDRAWLITGREIFAGRLETDGWSWVREATLPDPALADIAVDQLGHGYAVGTEGVVMEREEGGWALVDTGLLSDFSSVALPAGGGEGALIGGESGLILTQTGRGFEIAHQADRYGPLYQSAAHTTEVVGLALLSGPEAGQAEAWAATQAPPHTWNRSPAPGTVLHYGSNDPLLKPELRAQPLPDGPPARPGEISFAAFGRQECHFADVCPEPSGSNLTGDAVATRIVNELSAHPSGSPQLDFALFTGDATSAAESPYGLGKPAVEAATPADVSTSHRRWAELIPDRLLRAGIPVFGAVGGHDLSPGQACLDNAFGEPCASTQAASAGTNLAWRETMARMPAPWGANGEAEAGEYAFEPVEDEGIVGEVEAPLGGARTHYALDIVSSESGENVARLIVADTSLRSLQASDPLQNPIEPDGQLAWLDRMTCIEGSRADTGSCTRERDQRAIVLTNTPTYSYGPGALTDTNTLDGTQFEAILFKNSVDVVVTGRLGWNGLYYALAPGIHTPEPSGAYPEASPEPLGAGEGSAASSGAAELAAELRRAGVDIPPSAEEALSDSQRGKPVPFVIAASGGGKFGPDGNAQGSASEGFWRGYSVIRLPEDPREDVIVEQRPVFDWIGITAREHLLQPKEELRLEGYGREQGGTETPIRYDEIESPTITHRYDLLLADPKEPWVPCEAADAACVSLAERLAGSRSLDSAGASGTGSARDDIDECEPYVCLPERIGTIHAQAGVVRAGTGKYPETLAIALLSAGDQAATWPLVFAKSPAFIIKPTLASPAIPSAPTQTGTASAPPPPPPPPSPNVPQINTPAPPSLPPVAPLQAAQPPEPQPPAPPAPPPPSEAPAPLSLTLPPPSIAIATPTAVIQPPTPPVNPAPPGGARREARQRQAATQKSGADSAEGGSEGVSDAVDTAGGRREAEGAQMTRRDTGADRHAFARHGRERPGASFTPLAREDQPSAWSQGALYGGGIALMAAVLALGWSHGRPTPRRRPAEVPAPALARARRRGI